jgi:thiamine-monophosphate kinase
VLPPHTPIGRIGEKELLRHIRSRIGDGPGVVVGIGDDAAAVETGPLSLITTDSLVEGVHFRRGFGPDALIGRKALSVNLSDIDAMGGLARYATVSLCLPSDVLLAFVDGLYDGLLGRARETDVQIVGGNLSRSLDAIVVDVALVGQAGVLLRRSGARPGHVALVTGTLGAAALGLRLMEEGQGQHGGPVEDERQRRCLAAQLDPAPPLGFGHAVAGAGLAEAAIDVSDGLSGDLLNVCHESGVAAWMDAAAIPIDDAVRSLAEAHGADALDLALHGGEDYQLLLAAPPDAVPSLRDLAARSHVALSVIGGFQAGEPALTLRTGAGEAPLVPRSHEHFGGG